MRTGLRWTVAAAVGGAAVALSVALVRGEMPVAEASDLPQFDPLFPPYAHALIFPMGEQMRVEGVPMRLGYFTSAGTPQEVVDYYSAIWRRQSLVVTGDGDGSSAHASAFDGVTGVVHSVAAMTQGKHVLAFCSVTSLRSPTQHDARDDLIPIPERARYVERTASGKGDGSQLSVTYLIDATRDEHARELRTLLGSKGWQPVEARTHQSATGETLEFKRGDDALVASLFDDAASKTVGVELHAGRALSEGGAGR